MAGTSVFSGGKGLFTAWDPSSALRANPPPKWVAVLPDKMTPQLAQQLKDKGIALVIWEPKASQAGVDAVNQYGAQGYIAQAEGPEELAAAQAVAGQIHVPKALVTNNFMPAYPPGWIAMPEAYTNNNPNATADQVTRDALARGATEVIPVIGLGFADANGSHVMSAAEYQAALDLAGNAGASGSAAYIAEQTSDADLNAYTSGKTPAGTGGQTKAAPPDGGGQTQPAAPTTPAPAPTTPAPVPNAPDPFGQPGGAPSIPGSPSSPGPGHGGGTQPPGPQFEEGPLGENWNLGWQGTSTAPPPPPPYMGGSGLGAPKGGGGVVPGGPHVNTGLAGSVPAPFAPTPGGPQVRGPQVPGPAELFLNPNALGHFLANLPYLNPQKPTVPPYYNYGGGF